MIRRNILPLAALCCALPLILAAVFLAKRGSLPTSPYSPQPSGARVVAQVPTPTPTPAPSPAPAFRLTNIGGGTFSNADLNGEPAILWFTTTYCVPCQLGAEEVKKVDDDLGGKAFNVVMVFIDPRETDQDLLFWKKNFANTDWYMAHGNEDLIRAYNIRSLDTQYLVDKEGLVREVNYGLVGYEEYKEKLAALLP